MGHEDNKQAITVAMGFDYFYGFMGGETDQWTPYLFRDHFPTVSGPPHASGIMWSSGSRDTRL